MNLLTAADTGAMELLKAFTSRSMKALLGLKQSVNKDDLLKICLGQDFESWQRQETRNTLAYMLNQCYDRGQRFRAMEILDLAAQLNMPLPW